MIADLTTTKIESVAHVLPTNAARCEDEDTRFHLPTEGAPTKAEPIRSRVSLACSARKEMEAEPDLS